MTWRGEPKTQGEQLNLREIRMSQTYVRSQDSGFCVGFWVAGIGLPYTNHLPYMTKNRINIRNDFQTLNSDQHDMMAERVRTKEASP